MSARAARACGPRSSPTDDAGRLSPRDALPEAIAPAALLARLPPSLRAGFEVACRLLEAGWETYLVGGVVRDVLLGRTPHDLDIVTAAPPDEVLRLFPRTVSLGAAFGVVGVVIGDRTFQVATFRREGPYHDGRRPSAVEFAGVREDVERRDFTVNALLYDPRTGTVLDFVGGRADLAARLVRTVGDPAVRFAEDRLRLLRAVRLAAQLEFTVEPGTLEAICRLAPTVATVSGERIRDELQRLLTAPGRASGLRLLRATGLLAALLPEVDAMAGVSQPPAFHPEGDVFTHTCLALEFLREPTPTLALATLLHDVGKPLTMTVSDRIRFHGHAEAGAGLAERICRRLRLPAAQRRAVVALVRDHQRVGDVPKMRPGRARQFLRRDDIHDLLELYRADCLASHGDLTVYERVVALLAAVQAEAARPRLLTGHDLIAMGYRPGPQFATILDAVEDARAEGLVSTPEEARAMVRARFPAGATDGGAEPGGSTTRRGRPGGQDDGT
ncbi:MAG: CCA tRNA nucleotidyltransferase [Armatimonadota bacterium]|nr:CCA tRNA nucleotidyltransferase [Armatimonadota bacterium]MDR7532372.1 CCA tRNA nucleotidyltransferase [Armatimonadota bacterium]MDR7535299.1 CCA tRNA nucleotidyltransferase [Armatimonadota bacterium]